MKTGFQKIMDLARTPAARRCLRREQKMAEALVDECLNRGYVISVNDGEEWVVVRSNDRAKILAEMCATSDDTLVVRRMDGSKVGWFWFVYGNDGWDVISDFSANPICDEIWETVLSPLSEKLEEGLV